MAQRGQRTSPDVAVGIEITTAPEVDMRLHRAIHPAADPVFGVLWSLSHNLIIPVVGVEPGALNDTFTQPRGGDRRHEGIDILAPRGAAVVAATVGVILRLTEHDSGGITLYQLAPDGATVFYYAHLEKYAAGMAPGVAVRQGDVIAYVGDTGNAGAGNYHLHFEVLSAPDPASFWAARPRNPYPLLTRARG
jgi:murein DD-endopeptidase MepM/ murein hydrolase activator NlpD